MAETAKLLENTYRSVNIGLVNEMAQLCYHLGIDTLGSDRGGGDEAIRLHGRFIPGPESAAIASRSIRIIFRGRRGCTGSKRDSSGWPKRSIRTCRATSFSLCRTV